MARQQVFVYLSNTREIDEEKVRLVKEKVIAYHIEKALEKAARS
ncbi:hypothetical protein [Bacillus sp. T33-2]|nr:hypothetical protein [Bacillus sp. T33-2]